MDRIHVHLLHTMRANSIKFGPRVETTIDKMVAPSVRENYRDGAQIIQLALFECRTVVQRMRRYCFIERYKYFIDLPSSEMGIAFGEHCYALRGSEIYIIGEKSEQLLRFVKAIAEDIGLQPSKAPEDFKKKFSKEFVYRLRERHKITHAHERPSLVSRLLQLEKRSSDEEKALVKSFLVDALAMASSAFKALEGSTSSDDQVTSPLSNPIQFQRDYLKRVDAEAETMWRIFSQYLIEAVCLSSSQVDSSSG